jgi:hypothetical protein
LKKYGLLIIKNVTFGPKDLLKLTEKMGDEVVDLPPFFTAFENEPDAPQILRVGNLLLDGTTKDSRKESTEWHQDGSKYSKPHEARIINLLQSKIVPEQGGSTLFIDL